MSKGLIGHLEEYLAAFFGHQSSPEKPAAWAPPLATPPPEPPVAPELDESITALQALAREIGQRLRADEPSRSLVGERPDLEKLAKEAAVHHRAIAEDIVAMHEKFGTGLTRADLESLQSGLSPLLPYLAKEQGGMVERTYYHVLKRVLRESGAIAWNELQDWMRQAGLQWPEPGGLSPKATAEERAAARVTNARTFEEIFRVATPEQICERVFGVVPIWRASYPPRDSDLWFEQCLLGVAWGRQLQLFEAGAELLMGPEGEEIKGKLREAAREALIQTKDMLRQGNHSLWDVNSVLISTDRLASTVAPDLVWEWLQPRILRKPTALPV